MTDETTHLRALLADATARAEKAEAERDAALAACAEMRAAGLVAHDHACKMAEFHGPRCEEHERHDEAPDDCLRCAADTAFGLAFAELRKALSRPDLGRGWASPEDTAQMVGALQMVESDGEFDSLHEVTRKFVVDVLALLGKTVGDEATPI